MLKYRFAILGVVLGLMLCVPVYALVKVSSLQGQMQTTVTQSAQQRVKTVEQRCELTVLILRVLVRVHDHVDAAPFHASWVTCERQLLKVKQIANHAG